MAIDVKAVFRKMGAAIEKRDARTLGEILEANLGILQRGKAILLLQYAASKDDTKLVSLLVKHGADVNAPESDSNPEGALYTAAMSGAEHTVEWLLTHGARINHLADGVSRCLPLAVAVRQGHLGIVKILVEHGADINAVCAGNNALTWAITYHQKEIEEYLRSKGALEPSQLSETRLPTGKPDSLLAHIHKHLGKPNALALQEIVSGHPRITIHVCPLDRKLALVTTGMSGKAMIVPKGGKSYRFAELVMYLPPQWPLTQEALNDPNYSWPIEWLRRIARYPHDHKTWLGGKAAIFANGEPPKPLAPDTKMSCLLVLAESGDFGRLALPDGGEVVFCSVFPLYKEERDLERLKGIEHLLRLFEKERVWPIVDVHRKNVGLSQKKEARKGNVQARKEGKKKEHP